MPYYYSTSQWLKIIFIIAQKWSSNLCLSNKLHIKPQHYKPYHSDSSAHSFWWKVVPELGSYYTTVSMRSGNFSPHHPDFGSFLVSFGNRLSLGTVNKCNTFSKVEVCFFLFINSFKPYKGSVRLLIPQTSLIAKDNAFCIQAENNEWKLNKKLMSKHFYWPE